MNDDKRKNKVELLINLKKSINDSRNSSKEKESNMIQNSSILKIKRNITKYNSALTSNYNKVSMNSHLTNNMANNLLTNLNINNIVTPKNKILFLNNNIGPDKNYSSLNNNSIKYPIPKDKINSKFKGTETSNFRNLDQALKLSSSLKSITNGEGNKGRAVSHSPKNTNNKLSNININGMINFKMSVSHKPNLSQGKVKEKNQLSSDKRTVIKTKSNNLKITTSKQPLYNKDSLKPNELKRLPNLIENSSTTSQNDDKNTEYTHINLTTDIGTSNKEMLIFNIIYSKLMELKILNLGKSQPNNKNNFEDKFVLYEYFIKIFDSISINFDNRYHKISELLKLLYKNFKDNDVSDSNINNSEILKTIDKLNLDNSQKELEVKDLKKLIEKITKEKEILEENLNNLKKKYKTMKQNYLNFSEENKALKSYITDYTSQIEVMREKEWKMMELMYLLKKKGIPIDEVMKNSFRNNEIINNSDISDAPSQMSSTTVYFPDKISMNKGKVKNYVVEIPKLDFSNMPGYESDTSDGDIDNNNGEQVDNDQIYVETISAGYTQTNYNEKALKHAKSLKVDKLNKNLKESNFKNKK